MDTEEIEDELWRLRLVLHITLMLSFVFALLLRNRSLLVFALTGAGLVLTLRLLAWLSSFSLDADRPLPQTALEDERLNLTVNLRNHGPLTLWDLVLLDEHRMDQSSGAEGLVDSLASRGALRLRFLATCFHKRGRYRIGPLRVRARDPFGLYSFERALPLSEQEILLLPRPELIDLSREERLPSAFSWGLRASSGTGQGWDLRGLRGYRPGDPVRHIHWPQSARRGELLLKEFEHLRQRELTVLLVLPSSELRGLGRHSSHEYALRAALAYLAQALREGETVSFLTAAHQDQSFCDLRGLAALTPVLHELALIRPDPQPLIEALARQGPRLERARRKNAVLRLVLPTQLREPESVQALAQLGASGFDLQLHIVDATSFTALEGNPA